MAATFTMGTTAGVSALNVTPSQGLSIMQVRVPSTFVWGTDIIVVDITKYGGGAKSICGFLAFEETTAGQVLVAGTGTTTNSSGTVTYTSTGSAANTVGGTLLLFCY